MTEAKLKSPTHARRKLAVRYYALFLVLITGYTVGTFFAPIRENNYNLTDAATHVLQVAIILPIAFIWLLTLFAAVRFKAYAAIIKEYKDGAPLNTIANALLLLVFGSIANSILSLPKSFAELDSSTFRLFTIIGNYASVIVLAAVFIMFYKGSHKLLQLLDRSETKSLDLQKLTASLLTAVLGGIYAAALFTNTYRNATADPLTHASFYMNDTLLLLTVALPTILFWTIGGQAIANLYSYQQYVRGSTYRRIFKLLSVGLGIVLGMYILLTMLTTLSEFLTGAGLRTVLVFIYLILTVYGAGFVVIARGASKLALLEEV